jgi:hypothetical protein
MGEEMEEMEDYADDIPISVSLHILDEYLNMILVL